MAVSSMTGFARAEGDYETRRWTWELRSVNSRGLEMRFRLPPGLEALEPGLRKAAGEYFTRASLNATLTLDRTAPGATLRLNEAALDEALRLIAEVRKRIDCERPRAEGVLGIRGVIEQEDEAADEAVRAGLLAAVTASFGDAAGALKKVRRTEGAALAAIVSGQIDRIEALTAAARAHAAAAPDAIRARLNAQLSELLAGAGVPEDRLAQEAALLAIKADVREELDRLDAHVDAARALLKDPEPQGRRLDFLTQEFNREANTLCSKAQDIDLKRLGLELKSVVDQMREQAQNIE